MKKKREDLHPPASEQPADCGSEGESREQAASTTEAGSEPAPERDADSAERPPARQEPDYKDLLQRTAAELQNLQRRLGRERELAGKLMLRDIVASLLPSLDALERALGSTLGRDPALLEGVALVHGLILKALASFDVTVEDPLGQPLDPGRHEAVLRRSAPDAQTGTILEVFEKGYSVGGIVIRPARVAVAGEEE
jgi:molecular chaperone GrpE